ncbi:MAG: 30S ribosomal protein S3 [Nitrososphaerota archaeon]|nr:30S ribosomal protein S3 [Nitrososphaerota archaeon]MDG7048594.1 30S ribosomal protein S3 [Nitrososphaerota archaeon]MDG7051427.1 30S ribosomal protein S3 [Nitrososphaerota archaeon]
MSMMDFYLTNAMVQVKLEEYLAEKLGDAGFARVTMEKTPPMGTKINIYVLKPGLVIGKRGVNIKALVDSIAREFNIPELVVNTIEVTNPDLNPIILAQRIATAAEKGIVFRRAANQALNIAMKAGALGCEVRIGGKIRNERASFQKFTAGVILKSGYPREVYVDKAVRHVLLKMGLYGIQVRIYRENRLNEFKMKESVKEIKEEAKVETAQKAP